MRPGTPRFTLMSSLICFPFGKDAGLSTYLSLDAVKGNSRRFLIMSKTGIQSGLIGAAKGQLPNKNNDGGSINASGMARNSADFYKSNKCILIWSSIAVRYRCKVQKLVAIGFLLVTVVLLNQAKAAFPAVEVGTQTCRISVCRPTANQLCVDLGQWPSGSSFYQVWFGSKSGCCYLSLPGYHLNNTCWWGWDIKPLRYECPPHATLGGSTCTCNANYKETAGGSCALVDAANPDKDPDTGPCVGNPCLPATGAKVQLEPIYSVPGRKTLDFWLRYRSQTAFGTNLRRGADLGHGWLHRFSRRITPAFLPGGNGGFIALRESGQLLEFRPLNEALTIYSTDTDQTARLYRLVNGDLTTGWRLVDEASGIETYLATGFGAGLVGVLTEVWKPNGESLFFTLGNGRGEKLNASMPTCMALSSNFAVTPKDKISCITDSTGRQLQFTYDLRGNLVGVIDPSGQPIVFELDGPTASSTGAGSTLTAIRFADASTRLFHYDEGASFTGGAKWPYALTGISDEAGVRYATFRYQADGSAIETANGDSAGRYKLSYETDAVGKHLASVVQAPTGAVSRYEFAVVQGMNRVLSLSQPSGAGAPPSTSRMAYDANGNVSSRDDFNGNRTCRAHDPSRNLETARVEGLPRSTGCSTVLTMGANLPAGSRRISSEWHPDWRLVTRLAEPGQLTTLVYNGQPDPFNGNGVATCAPPTALLPDSKPIVVLCKRVEQATTDANGSLGVGATIQAGVPGRVQQFTYNEYGQVLSTRDALNNTTTFTYYSETGVDHNRGDLQSIGNALGQVTRFTQYNAHGQVLQQIDPNGVATDYSYDLRQRLTRVAVAGQASQYLYWPTGLLQRVVQSDDSYVFFDYDDAHRLVAIGDNLGNRIDYTLDQAGQRTAERVRDSSGNLARQLSRVHDALGRVQQLTGRE